MERLKTDRVPSREAQASRLLSSLANLMAVTGERVGSQTDTGELTCILVPVKNMVHSTEGIVLCETGIPSHGPTGLCRAGWDQTSPQGLPAGVPGARTPPLLPQHWQALHALLQTL